MRDDLPARMRLLPLPSVDVNATTPLGMTGGREEDGDVHSPH
jgi:hypothetical protein